MNLISTYNWLKKLWTVENLNLNEWLKEGCTPFSLKYQKNTGWFDEKL